MSEGSTTTSRAGEKTAYLSTWVRPRVKRHLRSQADEEGVTVAELLRQLVREATA